jgi:hypothetical protein
MSPNPTNLGRRKREGTKEIFYIGLFSLDRRNPKHSYITHLEFCVLRKYSAKIREQAKRWQNWFLIREKDGRGWSSRGLMTELVGPRGLHLLRD